MKRQESERGIGVGRVGLATRVDLIYRRIQDEEKYVLVVGGMSVRTSEVCARAHSVCFQSVKQIWLDVTGSE
jgi:hypothetical protein